MSTRAIVPANPLVAKTRLGNATNSLLQRKCECGGSAGMENDCEDCKKKKLQRRAIAPGPATAPPIVHDVLRSPGQPLDAQTRTFFEPRFGHDFSQVRVHADSRAAESARSVHALAYTSGLDVVFGSGQFAPDTKAGQRLLAHELTHVVQQSQSRNRPVQRKLEVGPANDALEQEAERFAQQITNDGRVAAGGLPIPPPSTGSDKKVQRAVDDSVSAPAAPAAGSASHAGLIVEDDAATLGPGQMRKTEFLDALRGSLCATADAELASTGRTAQGCPFIERWIAKLRTRTSEYVERGIRKYAPEGANAKSAHDYFSAVGGRVRQGVRRWATSGDVSGVPPELMSEMGGGGILGAIGGAVSSIVGGLGSAISGIGKLFTKAREGGAREANPAAMQAQLGPGRALDMGVKDRMEAAFGHDFSRVRVHADSRAAELSAGLNARAFTIGNQVAFAASEYQPGTLIGEALIAHELAHVMQQRDGASSAAAMAKGAEYNTLEEDADTSAVEAVTSMWLGGKRRLATLSRNAMPRLKSGLRLQRCGGRDRKLDISAWTAKQQKDFISKNFAAKDQSFAAKILQDMLESNEIKFFDEGSLKSEIAKRMETVQLLRKAQEPYGLAFDYPENATQCFPKGAPKQGQINKAARAYWGPVQFGLTYYFELTELGKNNAYKALTTLFTTQSNMCDKTLIHCDFLASVIHFRVFADQIGVEEFNRRVKNGDIEMRLAWNGFQDLEDIGWFHSKKSISIREVRPKTQNDLVIGDQVLFFNHRAYDLINAGVHHEWRLENAFLIDRRNKEDYFEGHGSGINTNHTMLIKLASEYNKVVSDAQKAITKTNSKDANAAAAARADMVTRYPNIKLVNGKWNVVGTSWGKDFNEPLRPLDQVNPEKEPDLPGLRDPNDPSRMFCIKRPSEAPGESC
ncbi:MAG: DUF4157 domain-containing protein [Candidatus Angelobacter sp.]